MSQRGIRSPAGRPTRADARRNYDRLLAEAQSAIATHGTGTSLEDIARRAGVGIGTLYRHFPTREALLEAVFDDGIESLRIRAENLLTAASPGQALLTWLREFSEYATTSRGLPESVKNAVLDKQSPPETSCERMRGAASTLLARAQQAGAVRPDLQIADVLRLVNGIAWAAAEAPDPATSNRLLQLAVEGFRPAGTPGTAGAGPGEDQPSASSTRTAK